MCCHVNKKIDVSTKQHYNVKFCEIKKSKVETHSVETHSKNFTSAHFDKEARSKVCLFNVGSSFSPGQNETSSFSGFGKSGTNIKIQTFSRVSSLYHYDPKNKMCVRGVAP